MIKEIKYTALMILLLLSSCSTLKVKAPEKKLETIVINHDLQSINYEMLRDQSELIVLARPTQALNMIDSHIEVADYYNLRKLIVEKVLKGNLDTDRIVYKEFAAIDEEFVYRNSDYYPLKDQERVILFLNQNEKGNYEISHGNKSVIRVSDLSDNADKEIVANTIYEFLNPNINGIKVEYHPLELIDTTDKELHSLKVMTDLYEINLNSSQDFSVIEYHGSIFKLK